jgi:hypothetical protein
MLGDIVKNFILRSTLISCGGLIPAHEGSCRITINKLSLEKCDLKITSKACIRDQLESEIFEID